MYVLTRSCRTSAVKRSSAGVCIHQALLWHGQHEKEKYCEDHHSREREKYHMDILINAHKRRECAHSEIMILKR